MTVGEQSATVEATPFAYLVQGEKFNFIYHEAITRQTEL
jgi:hypothetical protein